MTKSLSLRNLALGDRMVDDGRYTATIDRIEEGFTERSDPPAVDRFPEALEALLIETFE